VDLLGINETLTPDRRAEKALFGYVQRFLGCRTVCAVNAYRAQQLLQLINTMDPTDQGGRRRLLRTSGTDDA
jgi:hypothetical protein